MATAFTESQIKSLKARDKKFSISESGLVLEVRPNGVKCWFARLYVNRKEYRKSIGTYPEVSLKEARKIARSICPEDVVVEKHSVHTFADIYSEWYSVRMDGQVSDATIKKIKLRSNKYVLPALGDLNIADITSQVVLKFLREIEKYDFVETTKQVRQIISAVFRFAIACGYTQSDPTYALKGALKTKASKHYASIMGERNIAELMRRIDGYPFPMLRSALLFSALTFCRPGEIRHAEWSEFDFKSCEWRIPAEKMKMRRVHIVPLAVQTVELLSDLKLCSYSSKWLFPSARCDGRCMSENAVRVALRSMGYSNDDMTAHGFRGMASTRLNELGWPSDIIERQLAHLDSNKVRSAYNHADYLSQRRRMMDFWAEYLFALLGGAPLPNVGDYLVF